MKKIVCIVLLLGMLLTLCSCGSEEEEVEYGSLCCYVVDGSFPTACRLIEAWTSSHPDAKIENMVMTYDDYYGDVNIIIFYREPSYYDN